MAYGLKKISVVDLRPSTLLMPRTYFLPYTQPKTRLSTT